MKSKYLTLVALACAGIYGIAQNNIAEEVAWVVGDEPIYKSQIEEQYSQAQYEGTNIEGNPYCVIPERLAIEKLYLHQAVIDTVEVEESQVLPEVNARINLFIENLGSKEKVEEYFRKSIPEMREQLTELMKNQYTIQRVQQELTKDIKATPADVRKYFDSLSSDSVPFIPMQVEVQVISIKPTIPQAEIDEVKSRLRDYARRVNSGETEFSTLAILYSQDGSAARGGEIGFKGRTELLQEYASVAFNLTDPKKASKIVETEAGYHIIQLIEKRGDKINTRHILLKPRVSDKELTDGIMRLDSLRSDILDKKFTFEDAAPYVSQDKDTRNNQGLMINPKTLTPKFEMSQLPQEIAKEVDKLQPGEISNAFMMIDPSTNREIVAIVKLRNRIEGHKANLRDDYEVVKKMYEASAKDKILRDWLAKKINDTYTYIEEGWRNCEFEHKGWIK
ncbi:MAG: peptidylprolyl isomerase [Bacteroidales bacterium]|nr:peptidylprolyl isomerase [Bacteroidales bacterium]MDD7604805.1 peptidylprolyl isomerase [Bacteroidales bacterium]MDD7760206.1 peptidylprolyl isomerase [Bacteroidales bacterium]MDY4942300.1 peptidylprolyl isomerase [Candidatus Limisoma sp.]MDY5893447.1 peptidylprolyl isomerase [Candidatus Limisoma sp.]